MPAFHKALLLFNPVSGGRLERRAGVVRRVAEIFRRAGVEVQVEATEAKGSAGEQARAAVRSGCDAVFACGGDGTVLDVLQGLAETPAMMGVLPLGTGNVLAQDLGLSARPEQAAAQLLGFAPRTISLGRIQAAGCSRFFTVAAGVGVHAELIYRANALAKQRGGHLAYYTQGARLLLRHPFVRFPVEITTAEGTVIETTALELVAMRVRSFGGPLRYWRPGSSLLSPELRLVLLRNSSRAHIVRYTLQALTGIAPFHGLETPDADFSFVDARSVKCHLPPVCASLPQQANTGLAGVPGLSPQQANTRLAGVPGLRVQADGELLGPAPAEICIVPQALTLLIPPQAEWIPPAASLEGAARL